jgi:hypothetical protein
MFIEGVKDFSHPRVRVLRRQERDPPDLTKAGACSWRQIILLFGGDVDGLQQVRIAGELE